MAGVAGFLGAADAYLGEFASALSDRKPPGDLQAEALKVAAAFARLEQTFPSLAFEYNQLTRAQSELATTQRPWSAERLPRRLRQRGDGRSRGSQ